MTKNTPHNLSTPPLGSIDPHAELLKIPADDQLLYKVMCVEDLLHSFSSSYLHFNRVDSYKDFHRADDHDGQQLPKDQNGNANIKFAKSPEFSVANYYDQYRARTYACCFSIQNSNSIWRNYGNGGKKGKACLVVEFGKLRSMLNNVLRVGSAVLQYNGMHCHQIFSVNYGLVEYVEWKKHRANVEHQPNPIKYIYFKNKEDFGEDKELRVSLSAIGIGQFVLNDGSTMNFPPHLQVSFDFRTAIAAGVIHEVLYSPDCDSNFLCSELQRFGIGTKQEIATGQKRTV